MTKVHITTDAEWQAQFEKQGREARKRCEPKNPYLVHTRANKAWNKGYKGK